jgi:hypothetical protein
VSCRSSSGVVVGTASGPGSDSTHGRVARVGEETLYISTDSKAFHPDRSGRVLRVVQATGFGKGDERDMEGG